MGHPTISIAMCSYNGARYVLEQLESIAAQTVMPDEVVVCDDRSTDKTAEIVESFGRRAPFPVRLYLNEDNLGSTKNFEKAIALCDSEIILLSDQDDVWHARKLERIQETFADQPRTGAVFTDADIVDAVLRSIGRSLWKAVGFTQREQRNLRRGRGFDVLLKSNVATGATMAFRAHYKNFVLPIPGMWIHDAWIALVIAAVGELAIIEEPLVSYRQHSENQIGAIKGLRKQAPRSFSEIFSNRAQRFMQARDRLQALRRTSTVNERVLLQLDAKISHLRARGAMPRTRVFRLPLAIRELVTLRYHRYARGTRSFANDIFRIVPKTPHVLEGQGAG